ncbi:UDP-2,3-diacylglucosamine diphosphatase [Spiribacter sp. C176]|uniref:UDP-2,3-diacylglucosamine hydrolase n=1 Tax=Spiribacter salilacus TaxID=2664894 RepID=A0A6N7QTQ3_9GAMM|nr:UDP-2,3-diacylglucosamine diphosphatase [Spiribacter salilacus]MRH78763.1 UDP-2,3-diacylglucosamine diphosphatase [Spiribacter salilacus]
MKPLEHNSHQAPILMIADLHLDQSRPQAIAAFLQFLAGPARHAQAVYILGDLFEAWIGDDAQPADDPIAPALHSLAAQGVAIYLLHGNRDFLLGHAFAEAAGAKLLEEPVRIVIDNEPVILEHGDALCTDDVDYQALRQQLRNPQWQSGFLALPIAERIRQAQAAREQSSSAMSAKSQAIMDVNPAAVEARLREEKVQRLIHGHTHRPAQHSLNVDGAPCVRIVLGDWFEQGSVLRIENGQYELQRFSLSA